MRSRREKRKNLIRPAVKPRKTAISEVGPAPPNRIRELRKRGRLSLQELSALTGEPMQTLARWETKGGLGVEKLPKLAEALGVLPSELIVGSAPKSLTEDHAFLIERFKSASPHTRAAILKIVRALTDE